MPKPDLIDRGGGGSRTMTPEQFLEKIKHIEWMYSGDTEMMHSELDKAMEELLHELGYGEAVEYVQRVERWYA